MTKKDFQAIDLKFKDSGLGARKYFPQGDFTSGMYYYWKHKFSTISKKSTTSASQSFIPLNNTTDLSAFLSHKKVSPEKEINPELEIELTTINGSKLRIKGIISPSILTLLLSGIQGDFNV